MSELTKDLTTGLVAGAVAGGALGTLHHQLKPLEITPEWMHRVFNYAVGSTICLGAFSAAVAVARPRKAWHMALVAWEIWGISGMVVAATYTFDAKAARVRARLTGREARENEAFRTDHKRA